MDLGTIDWSATIITGVISSVIFSGLRRLVKALWARRNARARKKQIAELQQESARIAAYAGNPGSLYLYSLQLIMMIGALLALAVGIPEIISFMRGFSLVTLLTSSLSFAAFLTGWEGVRTLRRVRRYESYKEQTDKRLEKLNKADN